MSTKGTTRKKKQITRADINKNISAQIDHSIKKIKQNERKYTVILSSIFLVIILFVAYFLLSADKIQLDPKYISNRAYTGLTSEGNIIALSTEDLMSDEDGLKSDEYYISLLNDTGCNHKNKMILEKDDYIQKKCECENSIPYDKIKYSIDGKTVKTVSENGELEIPDIETKSGRRVMAAVRIWLDNSIDSSDEKHFHGKLIIK